MARFPTDGMPAGQAAGLPAGRRHARVASAAADRAPGTTHAAGAKPRFRSLQRTSNVKRILIGLLASAILVATNAVAQPASSALARIKAAKAINVAVSTDALPFSFSGPDTKNEPVGYSIDLCKRAIAQIGRAVGEPNLKVNWINGTTPSRLQMVAEGKADLECANTTQTLSRLANVDFSNLVFVDAAGMVVRNASPINRIADLAGRKIVVLKGTTTESRVTGMLKARAIAATVVPADTPAAAMAMLDSGAADAFANDKLRLVGLVAQAANPKDYALLAEDFSYEPYAFALPRGDSALRLEVNRALTQVYVSGEIETIFSNWLGAFGRPTGLLAAMYLLNAIPD